MAETFFTIYTGTTGRVDIGYDYTQDVANNTTSLTVKAYLVKTNGAYPSWNNFHNTFTLTVNGVTTSLAYDFDFRNMTTGVRYLITTAVRSITHNSDGSIGNIPVSVYYVSSTSGLGTVSGSGSIAIATIPRSSQPSLSASSQAIGGSVTVYTNRASSAFSHYIYLAFGSGTFLIGDGVGVSVTWTLPASLANQIPNSSSGYGTIYVDTYNGATYIGTKSVGFTVTVPDNASYRPTISALNVSISGAGRDSVIGSFVQWISRAYVSFSRYANGGASIVADSINIRRQPDSGNNQTISGNGGTSGVLSLDGTYIVTATATDSRGRSTSSSTTITVQPYAVPKIDSFTANRNPTTKTIVNTVRNGTYSSLGGSNPLSVQVQRKLVTETNYTTLNTTSGATNTFAGSYDSTGNSETASYNFRLLISDSFGNSASAVVTISTSATSLSIKRDIGIGVGKIWEQGALDVGGPVYFNGVNQSTFVTNRVYGDGNALSFWHGLETGTYFVQPGDIVGQPSGWGFMQVSKASVAGTSGDFNVLWFVQAGGAVYRKSGNSAIMTDWVKIPMNGDTYMVLSGVPIYYGVQGSGSNSNGSYLSFGDGTLICWAERTFSTTVALAWGSLFYHDVQDWTFPHAFAGAKPVCSATYIDSVAELIGMVPNSTLTNITFYGVRPTSVPASTAFNVRLMAIGRWK